MWTLNRFVPPEVPAGSPAVIPILSPWLAKPTSHAASAHLSIRSSVCSGSSFNRACTPQSSWQRLKACSRDVCHWAFFDQSKNHSGRWCQMDVCGNIEKARAFRERKRGAAKRP